MKALRILRNNEPFCLAGLAAPSSTTAFVRFDQRPDGSSNFSVSVAAADWSHAIHHWQLPDLDNTESLSVILVDTEITDSPTSVTDMKPGSRARSLLHFLPGVAIVLLAAWGVVGARAAGPFISAVALGVALFSLIVIYWAYLASIFQRLLHQLSAPSRKGSA